MKNLNSHHFENIYKELNIDLDLLGCIMLDLEAKLPQPGNKDILYFTKDSKKFWINGFVAGDVPHITLLYGLLKSGKEWKEYVDQVLSDWKLEQVTIDYFGYFDSPYENEEYYCIVAHIKITPSLLEGHQRLSFLPHVNTFPGYKAHMTYAYIKKDEKVRDELIATLNKHWAGTTMKITGINYGGNA